MTRMSYEKAVMAAFRGHPTRPRLFREEALEILKQVTGQDFGWNAEAWSEWLEDHPYNRKIWHDAFWQAYQGRRLALICLQSPREEEIFNPTPHQVKAAVERLDGEWVYTLILRSSFATLMMWSAEDNRVAVAFSRHAEEGKPPFQAWMLDTDVDNPDELTSIRKTKTEMVRKRCETVAKAAAAEVAAYFVEHDRLPHGFRWTEDVTPFLLVTNGSP
ncbi:MAG: hypothetical protein JXB07_19720 [Anaerolineae bacterium]|nr:hypothetical protein [Anaerolineae bacterium]